MDECPHCTCPVLRVTTATLAMVAGDEVQVGYHHAHGVCIIRTFTAHDFHKPTSKDPDEVDRHRR